MNLKIHIKLNSGEALESDTKVQGTCIGERSFWVDLNAYEWRDVKEITIKPSGVESLNSTLDAKEKGK